MDLGAVQRNTARMSRLVAPAQLCAVVKADGYGHGATPVARAALGAGATGLAVALVEEGAALRGDGIDAPVLVLSEPPLDDMDSLVAHRLTPTVYTHRGIEAVAKAVADRGADALPVHLKVDTGMHRVGAEPGEVAALAADVAARPELELAALWTHCAVADDPDHAFTAEQLDRFNRVVEQLRLEGTRPPVLHAANSAAALSRPDARLDLVRCGIALYGLSPSPSLDAVLDLEPAMSLRSNVSYVHTVPAGEGSCYGLRRRFEQDTAVATVPIGYADGVWRGLSDTGQVLIGGVRRPLAGTVTMDQIVVDCRSGPAVSAGDQVVLIGQQGAERITADEWAAQLRTINYEIACGIGARVPRLYVNGATA